MPRPLRWFRPDCVMEITSRTLLGKYALAPKRALVNEFNGILAEACRRWKRVKLHKAITMSTHAHFLCSCDNANIFARWMSFVKAAMARAAQAHHGVRGIVWGRRFRAIPILDEAALRARVKYLMAQACNEKCDLVIGPRHWPGVNHVDALCRGEVIRGTYIRSTERRRLMARQEKLPLNRVLELAPLPGLPADVEQRKTWFRKIEQEVVEETRVRQAERKVVCKPPETLRRWDPHFVPGKLERSPAPHCHSSCSKLKAAFMKALWAFTDAWREALEAMKRGAWVRFPAGGWWPFDCDQCVRPQLE